MFESYLFLPKKVKQNIADQKLDKTIGAILLNKQVRATLHWTEVTEFLDPSLIPSHLKVLVENTYLGNPTNFYYVLEFLTRNQLYLGFPMLHKELEMHKEVHSGQEVFALANIVRSTCGSSHELYLKMPKVVKEVLGGPVILQNVDNLGYIMANESITMCKSRDECYERSKSQIFIERIPQTVTVEDLRQNSSAHWQLVGPTNVTKLSQGFFIKNDDLFFIFKQSPASAFLRVNTTFLPYYARDMHAQFLPALIPNTDPEMTNQIRIGVRGRMFKNIEYIFSDDFPKKTTKVSVSRRAIFMGEMKGFRWEVTPLNGASVIDNTLPGGKINEKCNFPLE